MTAVARIEKICWGLVAICLGAAAVAVVLDWQMAADAATFRSRTTGEIWYSIHPPSLNLMQAVIERYLFPELWSGLVLPVMLAPVWLVSIGKAGFFAVLAMLLRWRVRATPPRRSSGNASA